MNVSGISTSSSSLWEELMGKNSSTTESAASAATFSGVEQGESSSESSEAASETSSAQSYDPMDTNQDGHVSMEELEKALELQRASKATEIRLESEDSLLDPAGRRAGGDYRNAGAVQGRPGSARAAEQGVDLAV